MADSKRLLAGLGNPGEQYFRTRHNIGFDVVDALADRSGCCLNKEKFNAAYTGVRMGLQEIFLVKPLSYMNRSGIPLQKLADYFKIDIENIIVVHDDMDLPFGKIKIVQGRGHGGHNGIRSIIDAFGQKACVRVRVGIGRPESDRSVTGHVLGKYTPDEQACLDHVLNDACDACLAILEKGVVNAMNFVNSSG
ncbi:MAG: aminoacyl-tRNA hydrolase [Desulfobacter postgatei]|uniref:aminoacyl-tRNA hydrolase n=1 Tax=Desulfobacter postgatei TaxID=2293 RepID=UPI0023F3DF36|nr:aminoacyl-tRNA hydrolase [Desulfobacter postgatei]MDD4272487.1 aminoacyl-tRNA hydrolase [Desulfobacter postgatei]